MDTTRHDSGRVVRFFFVALAGFTLFRGVYNTLFPQATLYYAIFEEMKESIQLLQTVPDDHIFTVRSQSLPGFIMSTVAMIDAVRKEKMDVVLDFELFSRISSLLSYLSGARSSFPAGCPKEDVTKTPQESIRVYCGYRKSIREKRCSYVL